MTQAGYDAIVDRQRFNDARKMLTGFFIMLKTARVYEANNERFQERSRQFYNLVTAYMSGYNSCTIKNIHGRLFVDDMFIHFDDDDKIGIRTVIERWSELGIGGLVIGDAIRPEQIDAFMNLMCNFSFKGAEPFRKVAAKMAEMGINAISLLAKEKVEQDNTLTDDSRRRMRQRTRDTFFRAIKTVQSVMAAASQGKAFPVARTKRMVHSIIDQITEDEAALMELAAIKDYDEYTYAHSTNVGIYSLTLGHHLGLSRRELSELGFAAIFHDIGKIKLPQDLINKEARFDEFDWEQMHQHPILGAMTIAKTLRLDTHMARAMAVAFEHHINPDQTGYPRLPNLQSINLYSRIVSIADSFDALTSGRIYIKHQIPADEVIRKLMYQMQNKFDPVLLKLFVSIMGIYPIGSLVLLSDKSLGIVTRTHRDDLSRPEVYIIADSDGAVDNPQPCDLSVAEFSHISIARVLDPKKYGIKIDDYILNDFLPGRTA